MKMRLKIPFPSMAECKGVRLMPQSKTAGWTDISCQLPVDNAENIDYAAYKAASGSAP